MKQIQSNLNISAWVKLNNKNKVIPRNFGDDINFHFLPRIFEKTFKLYKRNKINEINEYYNYYNNDYNKNNYNYMFIGSILKDKFI